MTRLQVRPVRHGQGDVDVLALAGELDLDSEDVLATAVAELLRARQDGRAGNGELPAQQDGDTRRSRLVLDCAGLTFCDSRGLGLLLTIRQTLQDRGDVLVLADVSPQLLRTLELTGADQVLTLADGVGEALLPVAPPEPRTGDASA
ncbi:STAS domain-containing protein [Streptomyces sp. So13.3]|uniref:STAS domain-containing protein n=1 Tax=Streptomyces TaxID=1883 RepID=UPI0011069F0C|nr:MULTISPECIES: STAS domain-containing protein [Streptomyces]MCZ4101897.1 STAS domain-containing protein [Streptomyces sp. H39-C1]QNA76832.1 STAS domain-containing protein [Streptomyces sp. So13.3]